jgi:hypothetical protein
MIDMISMRGGPNDGLYPCNDGTTATNALNCKDATENNSDNNDNNNDNDNYGGGGNCYDSGYDDGQNRPFDIILHSMNERCGDRYYEGFIDGCIDVEGNTLGVCQNVADA